MKLKEKMATSYTDSLRNGTRPPSEEYSAQECDNAFLAGFDKAREMSAERFLKGNDECAGMTFPVAIKFIHKSLENVGEEEMS